MEVKFQPSKTYSTPDRARRAVALWGVPKEVKFFIVADELGKYTPVFYGQEAIKLGFHLANHGWTVVG